MKNQDKALYYAAVYERDLNAVEHALRHKKKLAFTREPPYYKIIQQKVREDYYTPNAKRPIYHETAAHGAASNGDKDIVRTLFEFGWKPAEVDSDGNTVAQWAEAGQHHILKEWIEMMERARLAQLKLEKLKGENKKQKEIKKSHRHYV